MRRWGGTERISISSSESPSPPRPAASIDARSMVLNTLFATDALIRSYHTSPRGNPMKQALIFMNIMMQHLAFRARSLPLNSGEEKK